LENIKKALNIINKDDPNLNFSEILKIDFSNDFIYLNNFNALKRFDEVFIEGVCNNLKIQHTRMR